MRAFRNSFFWQFAGGFVIGAVGLLTFQPAEATRTFTSHFAPVEAAR
jgi:hypothetical protein